MDLAFTKMQGCANDYIYLDCRTGGLPREIEALARRLSARHVSVGADGVICICAPWTPGAVAAMRIFNADGSEGKMCGNAARCVGKYVFDMGLTDRTTLTLETLSGIKTLSLELCGGKVAQVRVDMGKAELLCEKIPVVWSASRLIGEQVEIGGKTWDMTCVSMGNPHCVVFCEGVETLALEQIGPEFEYHPMFPERVNTEFVEALGRGALRMRV